MTGGPSEERRKKKGVRECALCRWGFCPVAVSFRCVAGSAVGSGCVSWWARPSVSSWSGRVVVAAFSSFSAASGFASRWAARCGRSVAVRRCSVGWLVSVPVA